MIHAAPVVYVVDDKAFVRRALKRLLESAGLETVTFASAQEFLQASRPAPASCLVLDIRMPGIDGFELHRLLVTEGSAPPTIFITAHDTPQTRLRAQEAGAIEYLVKPFDDEALITAIQRAFAQAGASSDTDGSNPDTNSGLNTEVEL